MHASVPKTNKIVNQINPITSKMPKETEQQYTAFLLYAEIGSLEKLLNYWQGTGWRPEATERRPELTALIEKLGKPPALTTLKEWSGKYHWVERREIKLAEDLQVLREKTKKIIAGKKHKIAEAFGLITNKKLKQLKEGESVTTLDLKQAWEMFQVELGKPTSRGELKAEPEQRLPTPEEKEYGKRLHKAVEWYLEHEDEQQENIEKNNKTR